MSERITARFVLVTAFLLLPAIARAQATGNIAGVVRDTTGAVLPGVTVEAASPALIEKVRSVVSDNQGQYRIVDLRPGTYSVTFTLPGFNTFRREGIELTTGFTANVNAEMRVGGLEESITVSGATPVVDTQNVRSQTVLSREVLDILPTGKTVQGFAALTVGASLQGVGGAMQDVGGNRGEQFGSILIHGSHQVDGRLLLDGVRYNNMFNQGGGQARTYFPNQAAVQEVVIETGGMNAEQETGGVVQNSVPKDGGNIFSLYVAGNGANEDLNNSNLSDRLKQRGVTSTTKVKKIWDIGVGAGGPIRKDRLWFYAAWRKWGTQEYNANQFYNKIQGSLFYEPDFTRRGFSNIFNNDTSLRLTWQAAAKHKVTLSHSVQKNCFCNFTGGLQAPEASQQWHFSPTFLSIATWTYPVTSKLLFEAGGAYLKSVMAPNLPPGVTPADIPVLELANNFAYGSIVSSTSWGGLTLNRKGNDFSHHNERFSVSYITGAHAFKAGLFTLWGIHDYPYVGNPQVPFRYIFRNRSPAQLLQYAQPAGATQRVRNVGVYAQDQWTIRKLTLNLGVRVDTFNADIPAQVRPGGLTVPEFPIARIDDVVDFKDISPRLGAAYDLFGNGKTALKVSLGRYVAALAGEFVDPLNPANQIVTNATRTWTDPNGNFRPDCNLRDVEANGECGALDNKKFGTLVSTRRYERDTVAGWQNREYGWQSSVSVQQELRPGFGINVGYFRTWFGNFTVIDNLAVTPADYTPFCVTAPVDARLPGGGGYQICEGLADLNPAKFGQVDEVVRLAANSSERGYGNPFKTPREVYDGIDITFNARGAGGRLLQGGTNVGRTLRDCPGNIIPSNLPTYSAEQPVQFCKTRPPFFLAQYKLAGVYPLPWWGIQASATFQSLPGIGIGERRQQGSTIANAVYTSAQIAPSLGRNLAAGPNAIYVVSLFEQDKYFEERLTQLDFRLTKVARIGKARIQGMFDVYNLFNEDAALLMNTRYGGAYMLPVQILAGRLFKFGGQLDF